MVNVTAIETFTGKVNVTINGTNHEVELTNGKGNKIIIPNLVAGGPYTAYLVFNETEIYKCSNVTSNEFRVSKHTPNFIIADIHDVTEKSSFRLVVTESNGFTGNVNVNIGSEIFSIGLVNGNYDENLTISTLTPGTYNVTINFEETSDYYATSVVSNNFIIKPAKVTINITALWEDNNQNDLRPVNITITLNNGSGDVSVVLNETNDWKYSFIDLPKYNNDELISYTIKDISIANYTTRVTNNGYNFTITNTLKPKLINPQFEISIPDFVVDEEVMISVSANESFTGKVNVTIEGTLYEVELTKGKGNVTVKLNLPVGNHTALINFTATDKFESMTTEKTFKVNGKTVIPDNGTNKDQQGNNNQSGDNQQQPPSSQEPTQQPTQIESENSIPAKQIKITTPKTTKKISKRAKKLTITVKLKIRGKLAKNKKVKITLKGKKYTRKTNKKGIAKLTIKKAKLQKILRKVKVGKKLTYKVKYGKKTIKRSLKIKK